MCVKDSNKIEYFSVPLKGRSRVIANGGNLTMDQGELDPGGEFLEHKHPHEQIGYVLQGRCELTLDEKTYILEKGCTYYVAPNVKHAWKNTSKEIFIFMDVFYPRREDLLQGKFDGKYNVHPQQPLDK